MLCPCQAGDRMREDYQGAAQGVGVEVDFVGEVGDIDWRIRSAATRQRREEHRHKAAPHAVTGQLNLIPVVRFHVFCMS